MGVSGAADEAFEVDGSGSLGGELFDGAVEGGGVHPEALAEEIRHLELGSEDGGDAGELGGGGVVALEEEVVHLAVGEGVEEDGAGGLAVASGAADLLVVGLDGAGERDVDDGADVGFVYAHAEGDGGDDDLELAGLEAMLDALADGGLQTGVVGGGLASQHGGELFGGFAGGGVDDGGTVLGAAEEIGGELVAAGLGELDDLDGEVVAAKAVDEESGIGELKLGYDVALDGGGGGGGEGEDGSGPEGGEVVAEGSVVGAKVVTPGRDAVGFVDGDESGLLFGEHLGEAGDAHSLGSDEEELQGAVEVVAAGLAGLFAGEAGVYAGDA